MIQENYPAWPVQLRARIAAEHGQSDPRAIDLASALNVSVASFLDGFGIPATQRAELVTEALAIFLVQSADHLPHDTPAITRIEWLLTRISQRTWALQLARNIPAAAESTPGLERIAEVHAELLYPPCDVEPARLGDEAWG